MQIRYIRDWLNGSSANTGNHWVEIQVIDTGNVNRALGVVPTSNLGITNAARITDGNIATVDYAAGTPGLQYVEIDLGSTYNIKTIKVWHYYNDGRTYYDTKVEVAEDAADKAAGKWTEVFQSAIMGTYVETQYSLYLDVQNAVYRKDQYVKPNETNDLRNKIRNYWLAGTGAASDGGFSPNSTTVSQWDQISQEIRIMLADVNRMFSSPISLLGNPGSRRVVNNDQAAPVSFTDTVESNDYNTTLAKYSLMNHVNCFRCISTTFTGCSACISSCQTCNSCNACYNCISCNACVSCNVCNICNACQVCVSCNTRYSSETLKEDISDFSEEALPLILKTNIVNFRYKKEIDPTQIKKVGFIAEKTDQILSTPQHNRMDTYNSIGLLMKSVQELAAKNSALEEKIKNLESEIRGKE